MTGQPPPAVTSNGPTGRIQSLDILRGFALLGMIIVHFHDHSTEPGGVDDLLRTLTWRLVETKSHGTFAMLFGAGLALQFWAGAKANKGLTNIRLARRLGVLAIFGFCAHAFFGFNVLLGYAIWGFPLLLILNLNWKPKALIATMVFSAMSLALYHLTIQMYLRHAWGGEGAVDSFYAAMMQKAQGIYSALDAAEAQDSYLVLLGARLKHMAWFYRQPWVTMPTNTLLLFTMGTLFVRQKYFSEPKAHTRALVSLAAFGFVSWAFDLLVLERLDIGGYGLLRDQWLTFTYVCGALLIMGYRPAVIPRLGVFASAGRMALTNYLVQIATIDLIFSGYALGLGKVRPVLGLVMAITLFTLEAAFSTWWLRRYQFGPFEWLWRSATRWEWQKIRGAAPDLAAEPAS